jgi:hypothetical protein
MDTSMVEKLAV